MIDMFTHTKFARAVALVAVILIALFAVVLVINPQGVVQGKAAAQSTLVAGLDNDPNLVFAVQ